MSDRKRATAKRGLRKPAQKTDAGEKRPEMIYVALVRRDSGRMLEFLGRALDDTPLNRRVLIRVLRDPDGPAWRVKGTNLRIRIIRSDLRVSRQTD